jgi:PAS domain S-box-containing protein
VRSAERLSDQVFASLLEAAPDATVCVLGDGRIALVNAEAERLFGYAREELVGQPVEILVPGSARSLHRAHRARYTADPRPRPMHSGLDLAGRRRDGATFPAEISLSAIRTGDTLITIAAVRDVTALRQAASAAAQSAAIVQSLNDAVIGQSLERVITSWNPAAERLFGYRSAETVGRHIDLLIPPEQQVREKETFAAIVRGEQAEPRESTMMRKDGTAITVSGTLSPIADGTGAITGVSAIIRDLTAQQRADARFRGLLEAAPDAVVCVLGDGRIALVNAQAERLFGYTREELIGEPVEILVPGKAKLTHPAERARYMTDPRPRPMGAGRDLTARRRDGSVFPTEISLSVIGSQDETLIMAAVRDVTERLELLAEQERLRNKAERERLGRQLQQSQRLESLGQLAGGVAHDFNNLLAVISNYASFVSEEVAKDAAQVALVPVREDMAQIQRATERAADLIRQLLAFARRDVVRPRPLNLNEVIEGVQQLLVRTLGEHVELTTELDGGLYQVLADPGQIEQVLVNLAVNARDAMPGGGRLAIVTSNADIDEAHAASRVGLRPGRYACVKISDTGAGMPKEVAERVFDPFFTTKPKGEGTGLGLAIVYGIVTQAEGYVQVYSEPGNGTTFTILLPQTGHGSGQAAKPAQAPAGGHGETILLVEDEPAMREVTHRILTRSGYQVITAADGGQAVEAAQQGHIDLLLSDVVMPNMAGKEAAERIRALQPGLKVIFMSGYTHGLLDSQGVLDAGVSLIEKPFTEAALLTKLHQVIDSNGAPAS